MRRTPALIVGGGPAGASAAILLARAGSPHLLVERSRETGDALCGGFLSWRTLDSLAALGIEADALNRRRVTRLRLFTGKRASETQLPRPAIGVSRRRLDTLLLERAIAAGAAVERGVTARSIDGTTAKVEEEELAADALFLASGKHEVRGLARPADARGGDPTLGLRIRLPASAALERLVGDAIELHLFDRGYAGLVLQEDGSANLCMAVHRSRLNEAGDPERLLATLAAQLPHLGDRLAQGGWRGVDAVANVPYGWRAATTEPGIFRLGDQAAVIPSLAGEGMGIAIASGIRAAQAYLGGRRAAAQSYQRNLYRATARPVAVAGLVRRLAESVAAPALVTVARMSSLTNLVARLTRINHSPVDADATRPDI